MLSRLRQVLTPKNVILGIVILVILYLALVPVLMMFWQTFFDGGRPTLQNVVDAYSFPGARQMVVTTLTFTAGAVVISVVVGTALAYLNVRTDVPFKPLVFAIALLPIAVPAIVYAIAWTFLLSPTIGVFNRIAEAIVPGSAFDVYSVTGMTVVAGLNLAPIVFLFMYAAFRSMDPSLEESAVMSGARLPRIFARITLPLARPALASASLIMVIRGLEAFEVPAVLGMPGGEWVVTSRIYLEMNNHPVAYGRIGAYGLSLVLVIAVGLLLMMKIGRGGRSLQTIVGKGYRPHPVPLGRWRIPIALCLLVYFVVAVLAPIAILFYASTQQYYSPPTLDSLANMSLENYRNLLGRSGMLQAAGNTLILAAGAATAAMMLMAVGSWFVVRTQVRGRRLLEALSFLPLAVPGIVLAVALLFVYLRVPLPVYGTLLILLVAYLTLFMPYAMQYASSSMYQIGQELEEAAETSGASWWQTFRRVLLPLIMPGFLAGWIFIFIMASRELSSSILLVSPGAQVLPTYLWSEWAAGRFGSMAALGMMMVTGLLILGIILQRFERRLGSGASS